MLQASFMLLAVSASLAQVTVPRSCPEYQTKQNFNVARYAGKWYQAESFYSEVERNGKCVTATYTLNKDGTIGVENTLISNLTGELVTINGTAVFDENTTDAHLLVTFSNDPSESKAPYWIVDTDYDNWAVVYSCEETADVSYRFSWILTREQHPSDTIVDEAYKAVDSNHIVKIFYIKTDQTNCTASA